MSARFQSSLRSQLRELSDLLHEHRPKRRFSESVESVKSVNDSNVTTSSPQKRPLSQTIDFESNVSQRRKRDPYFANVGLQIREDTPLEQKSASPSLNLKTDDFPIASEQSLSPLQNSASPSLDLETDDFPIASEHSEVPPSEKDSEHPEPKSVAPTNPNTIAQSPIKTQRPASSASQEDELGPKNISDILKLCLLPTSTPSTRDLSTQLARFFSQETCAAIKKAASDRDFPTGFQTVVSILQDRGLLPENSSKDEFYEFCCKFLCLEDLAAVEIVLFT
ncbi:LAME_0H20538g1_1 [Lachancea meyersii CBS 8951]|uniref:LAME_0H20538g1_1 n=1 Tax=Lachancea meyersii CBS 8951 TaxID=1266667 RepID=A0A1G4KJL3_9SACH|nr:LAME_0H20538g1_1 [Lachancea meyersii CBS 8951]